MIAVSGGTTALNAAPPPQAAISRPTTSPGIESGDVRERVRRLVEDSRFQTFVIAVIVVNAITLGMETSPSLMADYGTLLHALDRAALAIFVAELALRLYAHRLRFFTDPWSVFDFVVVAIALVPASGAFSVLRAMRVLRVLRLVSMVPSMRRVVGALLAAMPGMASIAALLALVLYVAAVMATKLFGEAAPQYFGDFGSSLFSLFQIMTTEGWADIAREVMARQPLAALFFVVYILISTFTVLNLFIAVVVSAMEQQVADEVKAEVHGHQLEDAEASRLIMAELRALRAELAELKAANAGRP
jgi:voltage-gated sodium channel